MQGKSALVRTSVVRSAILSISPFSGKQSECIQAVLVAFAQTLSIRYCCVPNDPSCPDSAGRSAQYVLIERHTLHPVAGGAVPA